MSKDANVEFDISKLDRGDIACRARRAEKVGGRRMAKRALAQAAEIAGVLELGLGVATVLGHLLKLQQLSSEELASLHEVGERELRRLTADDEAHTESVIDLQVVLTPGLPDEDINSRLTAEGFDCFTDKRLRQDVPRTWQGQGQVSSIQAIVGSRGRVFVGLPKKADELARSVVSQAPDERAIPDSMASPGLSSDSTSDESEDAKIVPERVTMVAGELTIPRKRPRPRMSADAASSNSAFQTGLVSVVAGCASDPSTMSEEVSATKEAERYSEPSQIRYSAESNRGVDALTPPAAS